MITAGEARKMYDPHAASRDFLELCEKIIEQKAPRQNHCHVYYGEYNHSNIKYVTSYLENHGFIVEQNFKDKTLNIYWNDGEVLDAPNP